MNCIVSLFVDFFNSKYYSTTMIHSCLSSGFGTTDMKVYYKLCANFLLTLTPMLFKCHCTSLKFLKENIAYYSFSKFFANMNYHSSHLFSSLIYHLFLPLTSITESINNFFSSQHGQFKAFLIRLTCIQCQVGWYPS